MYIHSPVHILSNRHPLCNTHVELVVYIYHCNNSRVALTLLWLSQLQIKTDTIIAEVGIHATKVYSLLCS